MPRTVSPIWVHIRTGAISCGHNATPAEPPELDGQGDRVFRLGDIGEVEAAKRTIAALLARDLISIGLHDLAVVRLGDLLSECRADGERS
jgi:hypothetical protein